VSREQLLAAGADMSAVYVCDDGGTVVHALGASVFHWEDLSGRDADVIENDGGWEAADVARGAGVSVSDLLAAWRWRETLDRLGILGRVEDWVLEMSGGAS